MAYPTSQLPIKSLGYPTSIYVSLYWLPTYLAPATTNHPTCWVDHPPCVRSGSHQPRGKTSVKRPGLAGRNDHLVSPRFSKEVGGNSTGDHGEQWLGTVNVWQWLTNLNTEWFIMFGSYIMLLSPALVILYRYNVHCKRKAGNRIKPAKLPRLLKDRLRSLSWLSTQALGFTFMYGTCSQTLTGFCRPASCPGLAAEYQKGLAASCATRKGKQWETYFAWVRCETNRIA